MAKKDSPQHVVYFTDKEQSVVDALVSTGSYKGAAQIVHMKEGSLRSIMNRIRNRYSRAKYFVQECEQKQRMLSAKDRKKRYITG